MVNYTVKGAQIFDPLKDKTEKYIKMIMNSHPIKNSQSQINFAIGDKSKSEVRSYISFLCKRILNQLKLGNFEFVNQKFNDMKYLRDLVNLNDSSYIEDLLKDIKTYFEEKYNRIT